MNLSSYPFYMFICLILTLLIECFIAYILKYRKLDLLIVFLVNILTNPLLNATGLVIQYNFGNNVREVSIYIMEVLVVICEGFIFNKCLDSKKINPYLLSLILNVSSYVIGLIIFKVI